MKSTVLTLLSLLCWNTTNGFTPSFLPAVQRTKPLYGATTSSTATPDLIQQRQEAVDTLKKVLEREYVSFFNPMRTEFYSPTVTFDDPLTSLSGVDAYQSNVDLLAGRTLLGSILFEDGSINLHSVTGGDVNPQTGLYDNIVTRWTLKFCMKVWPWKPTARFSGISVYEIEPTTDTKEGVIIVGQTDYWDSINLQPGGDKNNNYAPVPKSVALSDFLGQLSPGGFQAVPAAPELPYQLLRRGADYEVRRYPAYSSCEIPYERRDEGFGRLGAFLTSREESPLGPAVMTVYNNNEKSKTMQWPLTFAPPGLNAAPEPKLAMKKKDADAPQWNDIQIDANRPSRVVAVKDFSDVAMEPVVRKAHKELQASLQRDGLVATSEQDESVCFAQYDAVFSMGKRRSEVWIDLEDGGHPW